MAGQGTSRAEIFNKLQALGKSEINCFVATHKKYDKETHTITVELTNGLVLPGVRLKAAVNENKDYYFIQIPRVDTSVLISLIGGASEAGEYYLVSCDEVNVIEIKMDETIFKLNQDLASLERDGTIFSVNKSGKITLKNDQENLATLIDNLINTIKFLNIQVVGVAGPYPLAVTSALTRSDSQSQLDNYATKFKALLE